jgi:hypothetical protein
MRLLPFPAAFIVAALWDGGAGDVPLRARNALYPAVELSTPGSTPVWAFRQRQLLDQLCPAAREFVRAYTRPDGTLIWREHWPGMDGSDDGYESFYNFALYYALGGPDEMLPLARRLWGAVTRQFTRYGQVYREFDGYYDWMHHGESYVSFYFFGLADPTDGVWRRRAVRFAGLYLNEDPRAPNYDPELRLIRSPLTGSRGPRFVNTAEDWVTHREVLAGYPLPYEDLPNVPDSRAWANDTQFPFLLEAMNRRMMRGDVPLNLTATSLILNAYLVTGETKYARWIEEYTGAWLDRARANQGILPDNVGLSGRIGECLEGKWWGGYYGWTWPHGLFNQVEATLIGAANAMLVSHDPRYLELPRSVIRLVQALGRRENGRFLVPHRHGDRGWYDYRPLNPSYLIHLWYVSQDPEDYVRIGQMADTTAWHQLTYRKGKGDYGHEGPWLRFLEGQYADYPAHILEATYEEALRRLHAVRTDASRPAERNVHHWQERNPVVLEGLVQTLLGGPNHIYHGGLLHARLRYFDAVRQRPGMPPQVAALVDRLTPTQVGVQLVNLHPTETRELILQAGAFGEHEFTSVHDGQRSVPCTGRRVRVILKPGAVGRLDLGMNRYVNSPTYATP